MPDSQREDRSAEHRTKPPGGRTKPNRGGRPRREDPDLEPFKDLCRRAQAICLGYVQPHVEISEQLHVLTMMAVARDRGQTGSGVQAPLDFQDDDPEYLASYARVLLDHLPGERSEHHPEIGFLRDRLESEARQLRRSVERQRKLNGG